MGPGYFFPGVDPVSYTHLDVYKRQLPPKQWSTQDNPSAAPLGVRISDKTVGSYMCQEGLKAQYYLNMAKALRIDTQQEILFKPKDIIASHNGE